MASDGLWMASTYPPRSLRDEKPLLRIKRGEVWGALMGVEAVGLQESTAAKTLTKPVHNFFSATLTECANPDHHTHKYKTAAEMPGTKATAVAGVKRKREAKSERRESKSKSKPRRETSSEEGDDVQGDILRLEAELLESRKHYNNIATLLHFCKVGSAESDTAILAAVALCRIFTRLLTSGDMVKSKGMSQSEALIVSWLKERYRDYTEALLNHFLRSKDARKQSTSLTLLMRMVKEESKHKDYNWKKSPLTQTVEAILLLPEDDATREEFAEKYFGKFDDIRFQSFKIIK
jgi:U3 small nucleolar RNA-associated protein 19